MTQRTVLITGATSGIGRAMAIHLTGLGHRVIATGWNGNKRDQLKADCPEIFAVLRLNVGILQEFDALASKLRERGVTEIDTVFANAGIHIEHPWDHPNLPYEDWPHDKIQCQTFQVNYFGAVRTAHCALPFVKRAQHGRILFMNGTLGSFAWHHHEDPRIRDMLTCEHPAYAASKAALNMFMVHLAQQHPNLFVASLNPGWIKTKIGGDTKSGTGPEDVTRTLPRLTPYLVGDVDPALTGSFIDTRRRGQPIPW